MKKIVIVTLIVFAVIIGVVVASQRHPIISTIIFAGVVWLIREYFRDRAARIALEKHLAEMRERSTIYILNNSLPRLARILSLSQMGYNGIQYKCTGKKIPYYELAYLRMPDAPDLSDSELEQSRKILNSTISSITPTLVFDDNTTAIPLYVSQLSIEYGKVLVEVLPCIDSKSIALAERHYRTVEIKAKKEMAQLMMYANDMALCGKILRKGTGYFG